MLATFCLRLACGLVAALLLLTPAQINPRFYRTHLLTALGLSVVAAVFLRELADGWLWAALAASLLFSFLGSMSWSIEGAPGGRGCIALAGLSLAVALAMTKWTVTDEQPLAWLLAIEFSSAALLGASTTAMLMGHSYLIAPTMALTPLMRLLAALLIAIAARAVVSGTGLWFWTTDHSLTTLNDVTILLPLRWGLGFLAPLVLGIMAWQTARIRSTQSATGILYVVVIFCFLGELISQLLFGITKGGLIP